MRQIKELKEDWMTYLRETGNYHIILEEFKHYCLFVVDESMERPYIHLINEDYVAGTLKRIHE